jgi:AraC family transcriptional regulator of arabinose operon
VEGQGETSVNGIKQLVQPGELQLLRPGDLFKLSVRPNEAAGTTLSVNYYLACEGEWVDDWWKKASPPRILKNAAGESMLAIFKELVRELQRVRPQWKEASSHLFRTLCIHIDRVMEAQREKPQPFVAQRMKQYVEEHAHHLNMRHLAKYVDLSESRASHYFTEVFGKSIVSYALEVRLAAAAERIRFTAFSLEHIAELSGFGSYSYFYRAFRSHYGLSPREYRKAPEWDSGASSPGREPNDERS